METALKKIETLPGGRQVSLTIQDALDDDVPGLAAQIAYFWVFAVPPLMVLIVFLGAWLERVMQVDVVGQLRRQIHERFPADAASVLDRLLDGAISEIGGGLASLGVVTAAVVALWSASNGIQVMMKTLDHAYGLDEGRSYVRKRATAIGLTILLIAILNSSFVVIVYGERLGRALAERLGVGDAVIDIMRFVRWPIAVVAVMLVVAILYRFGPSERQSWRGVLGGAALATALWFVASILFGNVLDVVDPGSAYGALGSVIVLMFFLYVTGAILLVGAEFNAARQRLQREADTLMSPAPIG